MAGAVANNEDTFNATSASLIHPCVYVDGFTRFFGHIAIVF